MSLEITRLIVGPIQTNCYIVRLKGSRTALVVDPGANEAKVLGKLFGLEASLEAILLTHSHPDHVGAAGELRAETGAPILVGAKDAPDLDAEKDPYGLLVARPAGFRSADILLREDEEREICGIKVRALATPGHSAGGVSYFLPEHGVLFSGDTLFFASIGRTDLAGGNAEEIKRSIMDKLLKLPEQTRVLPGHGPETTVGREKGRAPAILNTI